VNWIEEIYDIFQTVQELQTFEDQKIFADCTPTSSLEAIRQSFNETPRNSEQLKAFVFEHFEVPQELVLEQKESTDILQHIDGLWPRLTVENTSDKGSLIGVPSPYVLPGGRFREFFYWDSYFTMLGLKVGGKKKLVRSMVDNFSFLINKFGFIPNGTRTYFLSRSQPPFYALMIDLLHQMDGNQILIDHCSYLEQEYRFWMKGSNELKDSSAIERVVSLEGGEIANRYFDSEKIPRPESHLEDTLLNGSENNSHLFTNLRAACESGWDFSSRWLQQNDDLNSIYTTQIMPIDLNCLLYFLEKTLAKCYRLKQQKEISEKYDQYANDRKEMIDKYFWNEKEQIYKDYSIEKMESTSSLSLASLFPLFFNIASEKKADSVLKIIEEKFLKEGGLITTLCFSGQQWDAPNAWAPLQYIAYIAAKNYGRDPLADKIKNNWMKNVERVFNNTGKLMEKYNAIDTTMIAGGGEYPNQDGFGWTNGVYLFFTNE